MRIRFFPVAIGVFLAMCFTPAALFGADAWDSALKRYQLQLQRDMEFLSRHSGMFDNYCERLREQFQSARQKAELLCFTMLQRDRYDAFAVTFYSDRIAVLVQECRDALTGFEALRGRLAEIEQTYQGMAEVFASSNRQALSETQRQLFEQDAAKTLQFGEKFRKFDARATEVHQQLQRDLEELKAIAEVGDQRQNEVIRTIFFDNENDFIKILPQAVPVIQYWLFDCYDTLRVQTEDFKAYMWSFLAYSLGIMVALTGIGYLIYQRMFRNLLEQKMPELFARRRQFQRNFLILFAGLGIYWGEWMTPELDMQAFRQVAIGLIMLACLRLALTLRLNQEQQRVAFPVYYAAIATYFISMLLSIGMVSYSPLIILSTILSSLAAIWTLLSLRHFRRFETMERIFGVSTAVNFGIAATLGFLGFAYMSLTMMLAWFVVTALFQAIVALGTFIRQFVSVDPRHPVFNQILSRFFLPAAWVWLVIYLFGWVAKTYHVEARIYALLDLNLVDHADIAQFNTQEVFLVVFVALGLYFAISAIKLILKGFLGESAEFGLLPSFVILSNYVLWGFYVIFVLVVFKVQYSSILVVIGGMSMGLGFGLKEIVENFIAGLILLIGQQVRPGDIVEVQSDGTFGRVLQVSVRATVVETYDGAVITYPNAQVLTKEFRNWTSNNMLRRNSLSVGVAYGTDLSLAMRLILEAAQNTPGVMTRPAPEILCTDFGASSVDFSLRYWASVTTSVSVGSQLRREIYRSFADHAVSIPFPQLDVHVQPEPGKVLS